MQIVREEGRNSPNKGVTTGQIDHKIAAQLKFDDFDAIVAIVSLKPDAEYAQVKERALLVGGILSIDCFSFTCNQDGFGIGG